MRLPEVVSQQRFYKYLPYNTGSLKIISDSTLKFTHPSDFNDPFDCQPYYVDIDLDRINRGRPGFIREVAKQMGLPPAAYIQNKNKMVQRLKRQVESGEYHRKMMEGTGVFSLSTTPVDILMWSHYAEYHRGFIVEFRVDLEGEDIPNIDDLKDFLPLEVEYRDRRPVIDLAVEPNSQDAIEAVLTKSTHWSYEKEWRYIEYRRGPGVHPFNAMKHLVGVVTGAKMSSQNSDSLEGVVRQAEKTLGIQLTFHQAELKADRYEVWIPGHHSSS